MKTPRIVNIIFPLLFVQIGSSQTVGKSLQSSRLTKSDSKLSLEVKPISGHHYNLEAPTSIQKSGSKISPTQLTPSVLTVPVSSAGTCDYVIQTYVCDDKKTFCAPQKLSFTCADVRKWESQPDFTKKNSISVSSSNPVDTIQPDEKKKAAATKKDIFIVNDSKMALDLAKQTNKPLFIDFFGVWCPPCNVLDETVFQSPKFIEAAKTLYF